MTEYGAIAQFYDKLTEDIDYRAWTDYVLFLLQDQGFKGNHILELGCGTGQLTLPLLQQGYEIVGIDASVAMLEKAAEKTRDYGTSCILLQQDLREMDLDIYEIQGVVACNDVFNYILSQEELQNTLQFLFHRMASDGVLVFDLSSIHKLRTALGPFTFGESFEDMAYLWENEYIEETSILHILLNFFVQDKKTYHRYEEEHAQKGYAPEEIQDLLEKTGFSNIKTYSDFNREAGVDPQAHRLFFSCKKP